MPYQQKADAADHTAADDKFRMNAPQISLLKGGPYAAWAKSLQPIRSPAPDRCSCHLPPLLDALELACELPWKRPVWFLLEPFLTLNHAQDRRAAKVSRWRAFDVFDLLGDEELVPACKKNPDGSGAQDKRGNLICDEESRNDYLIKRYQPRVEGSFARIDRWTLFIDGDTPWRSISKDNILKVYGSTPESRIADPANPGHVFSWLICQSYDEKGNAIVYEYVAENADNTAATLGALSGGKWPARLDPFTTYRSGFELRCCRLCRRVLMVHHFPDKLGVDSYLVRSTEFAHGEKFNSSFVSQILQSGFNRIAKPSPLYLKRSLQPLEFGYSVSPLDELSFDQLPLQEVDEARLQNISAGIDGSSYRWLDLYGEGISGVFCEQADSCFYKPNLGEGQLSQVQCVSPSPSLAALNRGRQQLLDLAGVANLDLVDFEAPTSGLFDHTDNAGWDRFRTFIGLLNLNWQDPNLRFVDLTGDGNADILITDDQVFFTWHESYAEEGFGRARRVPLAFDEEARPRLMFADGT